MIRRLKAIYAERTSPGASAEAAHDGQSYRLSDGKVSWEETRNAAGYAACMAR